MPSPKVEFLISDIIHPEPAQVLRQLYQNERLAGEVVALTDDGSDPQSLLVVKVAGLSEPVIVPAARTSSPEKEPDLFALPDDPSELRVTIRPQRGRVLPQG